MLDLFTDGALPLLANEKTFVDDKLLYVAGGLLVAFALAVSFLGMRRHEDFPSSNAMKGMAAIAGVLVVATAFGAVQSARFEQAERRAENEEAAKEAGEAEQAEEGAEAGQGAGEAAEPGTSDGAAPGGDGGAGGSANVDAEGEQIFTSTGCGSCHTLAAAGASGEIGPNLDEVLPGQSADAIRTSIIDPGDTISEGFPDGTMPSDYSDVLDETQLDILVEYLQTNAGT
jgi:hypothetical protein